ncbi:beta-carotene ketolase (CrtW type) [Pedobacter psychrotolerans]|uniref:Beta-carotene ketolase (CrtW type) n=1 Tax=Pedobacter psychrotolerans TaxID=1843235 RepID=A0A4R2H979_9SPHI|nr:fatty acid desaturase [Pedobacter psychrotolerans]TCO23557.1 beta-carotene ketolase (CrtW type) [Pedobacter psychrotolerans]
MKTNHAYFGVIIALLVIALWLSSLSFLLSWNFAWSNPFVYLMIFVQMHLYTGLFITAHDAMHGTISPNKTINNFIGYLSVFLYAGFFYNRLYSKHHKHHSHVHTEEDPDFAPHGFWKWYLRFMLNYVTIIQLIIMAAAFNVLQIWFEQRNLLLFWVLPSLLSTFQLFYFGTYQPHKGDHENEYHSSTLQKNHLLAFFTCYFFGYHLEHHQKPATPWWQLYKTK